MVCIIIYIYKSFNLIKIKQKSLWIIEKVTPMFTYCISFRGYQRRIGIRCLFVSLYFYLSVSLSFPFKILVELPCFAWKYLLSAQSLCLFVSLSFYLSVSLSFYLSVSLSFYLSVSLYLCFSISLSLCLSISLSLYFLPLSYLSLHSR